MRSATLLILFIILSAFPVSAETITVSNDLQAALNDAENGDTIILTQDLTITKPISIIGKSLSLNGNGHTITIKTDDGLKNGLLFSGRTVTSSKLSESASEGSYTVTLQDTDKVQAGDLIKIYKSVLWCPKDYPEQKTGEMYEVRSVSGNEVTLTEPLLRDYPLSDDSSVIVLRPVEIHITNLKIQDSNQIGDRMAITLEACKDSSIKNVNIRDSGLAALSLYSCYNCEVSDCDIRNSIKSGSGYGVGAWSGSANIDIHDNYIENCRHCITGNTNERLTLLRDISIHDNELIGATIEGANPVDAHAITLNYEVKNNKITVFKSFFAFIDGSLDSEFSGNTVYGGRGGVVYRGNINGGTHTIKNNYVERGYVCYLYGGGVKDRLVIENNKLGSGVKEVSQASGKEVSFNEIVVNGNTIGGSAPETNRIVDADNEIIISSGGAHSEQKTINDAINEVSKAGGGTVYLREGEYLVNSPVIIKSNIKLKGDRNAVIRVSPKSKQWFTGPTGIISSRESLKNVEISGFQIDGNIRNLPKSYANSRADTRHDCEKLILIGGYSNDFAENIRIHDMKFYDAFSDGIYIRYSKNVQCYDNVISNCQHDGIFFSVVHGGVMKGNKIAGITSDCARLDNCQDCKVYDNVFFAYTGDSYGAYKLGHNLLQIGDAGVSKGYDGRKPDYPTKNIEVYNNVFAGPSLRSIWHHGGENVYIHDNEFVDSNELETMGISIDDVSYDNPPTIEQSEQVFDSIFDVLDMEFTNSGRTGQSADSIPLMITEETSGLIAGGVKIIVTDIIHIDGVPYIPGEDAIQVQTKAIRSPDIEFWAGIIQQIDKDINIKIEDGTAYAEMTVSTHWYTVTRNPTTGRNKKSKIKTSKSVFTDSIKVPEILQRPTHATGYINEYRSDSTPNTRVYVPSEGLTKIVFEYAGETEEHTLMIGERQRDENGIIHTNFTRVDRWDGSLSYLGDSLIIYGHFDRDQLKVTCYTPYEEFQVTDFQHTVNELPKDSWTKTFIAFLLRFLLMLFCGYKLMRVIIPP